MIPHVLPSLGARAQLRVRSATMDVQMRRVDKEVEQRVKPHLDKVVQLEQELAELREASKSHSRASPPLQRQNSCSSSIPLPSPSAPLLGKSVVGAAVGAAAAARAAAKAAVGMAAVPSASLPAPSAPPPAPSASLAVPVTSPGLRGVTALSV